MLTLHQQQPTDSLQTAQTQGEDGMYGFDSREGNTIQEVFRSEWIYFENNL